MNLFYQIRYQNVELPRISRKNITFLVFLSKYLVSGILRSELRNGLKSRVEDQKIVISTLKLYKAHINFIFLFTFFNQEFLLKKFSREIPGIPGIFSGFSGSNLGCFKILEILKKAKILLKKREKRSKNGPKKIFGISREFPGYPGKFPGNPGNSREIPIGNSREFPGNSRECPPLY